MVCDTLFPMKDKTLFEQKPVPDRKLSKWEIAEKQELARKYGVKLERQIQTRNFKKNDY